MNRAPPGLCSGACCYVGVNFFIGMRKKYVTFIPSFVTFEKSFHFSLFTYFFVVSLKSNDLALDVFLTSLNHLKHGLSLSLLPATYDSHTCYSTVFKSYAPLHLSTPRRDFSINSQIFSHAKSASRLIISHSIYHSLSSHTP